MSTDRGRAPLRVSILNDYAIVVAGLAAVLEPFADRITVVEMVSGLPPARDVDLVLYDTFGQMQGSAIDVPAALGTGTRAKLVIYSWNLDPRLVEESLAVGASAYLSKALKAEELVGALEAIHRGARRVPDGKGAVAPRAELAWPGQAEGLSPRESEIIALITQGLTNQDIAARSFLSINSVKTYIRTAYRKMGVQRRPQAILWGLRHGFAPDHERHVVDRR